ncbi:MAG TPA: hypothetical protein DHV69_04595 [Sphaerochaeta sp.]|nr:hypothetical protein [Sphaerochaeta sp.]
MHNCPVAAYPTSLTLYLPGTNSRYSCWFSRVRTTVTTSPVASLTSTTLNSEARRSETTSSYGTMTLQLDISSQTVSRPENPLNSISIELASAEPLRT